MTPFTFFVVLALIAMNIMGFYLSYKFGWEKAEREEKKQ